MPSTPSRCHASTRVRVRSGLRPPDRARVLAAATLASGVLALGLSGCTGSPAAPAARTGAAASGALGGASGGGSYADSGAVLSALKKSGEACTPVSGSAGTAVTAPGLRSISACTLGSAATGTGTGTVTASVFDDHADAEAYAELLTSAQDSGLLIGSGSARAVLGQNWVVLVDGTAAASRLGAALGGTVVGGPSSG